MAPVAPRWGHSCPGRAPAGAAASQAPDGWRETLCGQQVSRLKPRPGHGGGHFLSLLPDVVPSIASQVGVLLRSARPAKPWHSPPSPAFVGTHLREAWSQGRSMPWLPGGPGFHPSMF